MLTITIERTECGGKKKWLSERIQVNGDFNEARSVLVERDPEAATKILLTNPSFTPYVTPVYVRNYIPRRDGKFSPCNGSNEVTILQLACR